MRSGWIAAGAVALVVAGAAAGDRRGVDRAALQKQAAAVFGTLPEQAGDADNPITGEKITLGRMLYFETRLSPSHETSCNSCHPLDRFGVDGERTAAGHAGQPGGRNSPSVYNAALHVAQFWDGRADDVEQQAEGPVLDSTGTPASGDVDVIAVLKSIPGYASLFEAAFPDQDDPVTRENLARAIGAFERRLMTPGRFDEFLDGDSDALTDAEIAGLQLFLATGCHTCHRGPAVGGTLYRKLGLVEPYEMEDLGRFEVTGQEDDRYVFKVPSLRNVAKTAPYLHDGSLSTLAEVIPVMARHQLGRELSAQEAASIEAFLGSLTGEIPARYVERPELPPSGPDTPKPDKIEEKR